MGKFADFIVVDDPTTVPPDAIGTLSVSSTRIGGEKLYER